MRSVSQTDGSGNVNVNVNVDVDVDGSVRAESPRSWKPGSLDSPCFSDRLQRCPAPGPTEEQTRECQINCVNGRFGHSGTRDPAPLHLPRFQRP
jgi:hypothetical protein